MEYQGIIIEDRSSEAFIAVNNRLYGKIAMLGYTALIQKPVGFLSVFDNRPDSFFCNPVGFHR